MDEQLLTENLSTLLADRYAEASDRVARSGFRDPVARALRDFAKADGEGGASFADPGAKAVSVDTKTATARFLITSKAEDRHGDVVEPHGCQTRLERYAKNPVVFFGHKSYGLPIGRAVGSDGAWSGLEFTDAGVISPVKFHLKTLESEQVFALVDAGELNACSIGFIPHKAKVIRQKADPDSDERPRGEIDFEPYMKFRFLEWELLEWSVVAVPANPECVSLRLSKGIGGKALSASVARYLEPYAAPSRIWSPGATLEAKSAPERGRKAIAGSVKALEAKVDSLTSLVEKVALGLESLTAKSAEPVDAQMLAAVKAQLAVMEKSVEKTAAISAPSPKPMAPSSPTGSVDLGLLMAELKRAKEAGEAQGQALRKLTGKVD